jgi:hypothetical protein
MCHIYDLYVAILFFLVCTLLSLLYVMVLKYIKIKNLVMLPKKASHSLRYVQIIHQFLRSIIRVAIKVAADWNVS